MNLELLNSDPSSWLTQYGDYLYSFCRLRVGHAETAEDLVQETLLSAFKARDSFKGQSSEITWLVSILKNKITDYYRKKDILRDAGSYLEGSDQEFAGDFFDAGNGHWLRSAAPQAWVQADSAVINEEFETVMGKCLQKLPQKLAPVFMARFFDDEEAETICKVHGISPSNYWVIIHRAKVMLRACLEKNWFNSKMTP